MGTDTMTKYCSFCGKAQYEVAVLVQGPVALICDECVQTCTEVINKKKLADAASKQTAPHTEVEGS